MKIYLFETKLASAPFLKAFSSRHEHKIFNAVEETTAKGKGADRFYHYNLHIFVSLNQELLWSINTYSTNRKFSI